MMKEKLSGQRWLILGVGLAFVALLIGVGLMLGASPVYADDGGGAAADVSFATNAADFTADVPFSNPAQLVAGAVVANPTQSIAAAQAVATQSVDATGAVVQTDEADYAATATPVITGSGFTGNSTVTVTVTAPDGTATTFTTTTDLAGNWTASYTGPMGDGTFTVTATEGTTTAMTTFTDGSWTTRKFSATISPTTANTSQTQSYTLTVTNDPSSDRKLGSATADIPSGFTSVSITGISYPSGDAWTASIVGTKIKVNSGGDQLEAGDSVTVTFDATAPGSTGTYTWTTKAYDDAGWSGDQFNIVGSQPKVTVSGPEVDASWDDHDCAYIDAHATGLDPGDSYYVTYTDPDSILQGTSSTYTGADEFYDSFAVPLLSTPTDVLGTWTVKLYQTPGTYKDSDTVNIDSMVWTTNSTYDAIDTSFAQGETVYFLAIGLSPGDCCHDYYYNFKLEPPTDPNVYVYGTYQGPDITQLTGSYDLSATAETGTWEAHVRQARNAAGTSHAQHYVDCYFTVTEGAPTMYYLTVTSPVGNPGGQGWSFL